jgi:hypothetical protein
MLDSFEFIVIHGLGAAIGRAIELATVIQASFHDQVTLDVTTSTVTLIDDIIPEDPVRYINNTTYTSSLWIADAMRLGRGSRGTRTK